MAGLLSMLFGGESSAVSPGTGPAPESNMAYAHVSPDDNYDGSGGSQGARSFNPDGPEARPDVPGEGQSGPLGPPSNDYLESQSGSDHIG